MKTKLAAALLVAIAASSSAYAGCTLNSYMATEQAQIFHEQGGWNAASFEEKCEKIKRAHARVAISSMGVVLSNMSIGWASLTLLDEKTNVGTTDWANKTTYTNPNASQDQAEALQVVAINDALDKWYELDKAIEALNKARAAARKAYAKN